MESDYIQKRFQCTNKECNTVFRINVPKKEGTYKYKCPKCGKLYTLVIGKKNTRETVNKTIDPRNLNREQIAEVTVPPSEFRKGIKGNLKIGKKIFQLKVGRNVIGRKDESMPSDINIDNDRTISRRSIEINVNQNQNGGYMYKLKVLKATNIVYLNNNPLQEGESTSLMYNDRIQLGKTQITFIEDK